MRAKSRRLDPTAKLNLKSLQEDGAPDIYRELVHAFIKTSEKILESMKKHVSDREALKLAAHSWKSSAAAIGAKQLTELCLKLEGCEDPRMFKQLVSNLETEYTAVSEELLASID